ncbi:hypothetical protein [Halobaculum rarum]|uniref:hypothetical protein n=1 Tax=Halobaculum rarum TaxID=3075122 RepID=UPI0032AF897C
MHALHRRSPFSETTTALIAGVAAAVGYALIVLGYSVLPSSGVSISGTLWHALVIQSTFALGTVGVPIVLWIRADLRSPVALLAVILLFWHVLVEFPPFGSGQGDSPGFLFVFVFAPFYVLAYALLAGGEYWLRIRDVSIPD